ncbi:MAG: hypothetical protein RLZZ76_11 [Candidatus Parcubacteria bacterium]|jgi:hypothetical protein
MNHVTHDEKDALTKTFAIVGFIVLVIFGVWLAVKIVSFVPSAFSSLASLADSVYNYDKNEEIIVTGENNVYNAGEAFTLSWEALRRPGTYTFSYACTEGVSVDTKDADGKIVSLTCGQPLTLGNSTSLEVLVASEKNRFTDIPYTITYTKDGSQQASSMLTRDLTIVNVAIPTTGALVSTVQKPVVADTATGEKSETPVAPKDVAAPKTKPATYVAPKPVTTTKTVYTVPISNPNGSIDLQVTYIGSGKIVGSTFIKQASIDADESGAIQFEVKNIGTKTADVWSYVANLPADIDYTSGAQKALKPNERAIITLGFEGLTKSGTEKVSVTVTAKNDTKTTNNKVSGSVVIKD